MKNEQELVSRIAKIEAAIENHKNMEDLLYDEINWAREIIETPENEIFVGTKYYFFPNITCLYKVESEGKPLSAVELSDLFVTATMKKDGILLSMRVVVPDDKNKSWEIKWIPIIRTNTFRDMLQTICLYVPGLHPEDYRLLHIFEADEKLVPEVDVVLKNLAESSSKE